MGQGPTQADTAPADRLTNARAQGALDQAPKALSPRHRPAPAIALNIEQACEALNVSHKLWREAIEPELRIIRVGRCKRVAVSELERWCDEKGE
jgi:hypothetical protein